MPQILPERAPKRPSVGQQLLGGALSGGADYLQQLGMSKSQKAADAQRGQKIKELTGQDYGPLNDQQFAQIATQIQKNFGKEQQANKLTEALTKLRDKRNQQPNYGEQLAGGGQSDNEMPQESVQPEQEKGFNASPEDILEITALNPQVGNAVREIDKATEEKRREKAKQVTESYKENQDYINKTYDQKEDAYRRKAILDRISQNIESGELSDPGLINTFEMLGLPIEMLKNPANEETQKLALDLLGGGSLQADYGSRVYASEYKTALQRIPALNQTDEGKRQIIENMKFFMLPGELKANRMEYYIEKSKRTGDPLPHDLRGTVLRDIRPQLDEAADKFRQRNGRYKVKEGTPLDSNAVEKYYWLSNKNMEKAEKMMKEDGYDVSQ